jgi:Recombination endonuclease VII
MVQAPVGAFPPNVVAGMGSVTAFEIGQQLGHLTVLQEIRKPYGTHTRRAYVCQCVCGTETTVLAYNLKKTRSCGCQGKTCSKCGNGKLLDEFNVGPGLFGRSVWCRQCRAEHYEGAASADPDYARRQMLWARYRMTLEGYEVKLAAQGGVCAMCGNPPRESQLHVDHDHACCPGKFTCGKCVRDLLCPACNNFLGKFEGLTGARARTYLRKWREVVTCHKPQ